MAALTLAAAALVAVLQALPPADTVRLDVETAFSRALSNAPSMEAARRRLVAAEARVEQTRAWPNPILSATAENLGATQSLSGARGVGGVEGQVVLGGWLPLGGDRGAARELAAAHLLEASSLSRAAEADLRLALIEVSASAERDRARYNRALEEAAGLEALADALARQASLGRASDGEAARAHLAAVSARALLAQVAVETASSSATLAALLGLAPGTVVTMDQTVCTVPSPEVPPESATEVPELAAARARAQAGTAAVAESGARRVPDLQPQVGIRRSAGVSALYVGMSFALPIFDRGGSAVVAAREEAAAAAAELVRVERATTAAMDVARRGLFALEDAGRLYDEAWVAALERSVSAAEARYRVGEGTLNELLDGRRARLQALDDYDRWRTDLLVQRARLARLAGTAIDATMLCRAPTTPSIPSSAEHSP